MKNKNSPQRTPRSRRTKHVSNLCTAMLQNLEILSGNASRHVGQYLQLMAIASALRLPDLPGISPSRPHEQSGITDPTLSQPGRILRGHPKPRQRSSSAHPVMHRSCITGCARRGFRGPQAPGILMGGKMGPEMPDRRGRVAGVTKDGAAGGGEL